MATQNFSYLNITVNTKTGLSTAQQAENIALYGTNPANILFDEANKMIYVKGSPYCGKDWTSEISEISGIKTRLSTAETSITQIKAFLTGTASTIGGTFASNKYSIALTGLPTSGADKVNKTVKDYVNKLVTKVTALETGVSNLQGSTVSSITTNDTGIHELLSSGTGPITLNGNNLLVGNSQTGTGDPSHLHNSTISGAIHNIVENFNWLASGETSPLIDSLNAIRDIKEELEWDETAPSALNTIIDNLRRLKTNSTEYMGVKGSVMGAGGIEGDLMILSTGIPTNEAPISLQSAINNIATVVNNNAQAHANFVNGFADSYIANYACYLRSSNLDWYNNYSYALFDCALNLKLLYNNGYTYIDRGNDNLPAFYTFGAENIPSAYEVHSHVIDMARSNESTGIPYQIADLSYIEASPSNAEGLDSENITYLTYKSGILDSIVQQDGKLRVSAQFNTEITQRINNAKSDAYSYVNTQISNANIITWTELT